MTCRVIETPIGPLTAAADKGAVVWLLSGAMPPARYPPTPEEEALLDRLEQQLKEYFCGVQRDFDLPVRLTGTPFQRQVWEQLRQIPYGEKRTYGEVAAALGRPKASRAVGAACGRNDILLLVPCHRVVGKNGALTGFSAAGGLAAKEFLLRLEQTSEETP
ncbi:MAG: methylated-DNA--[protein]-cysteine S-methyltransferase [Clostridiales bacterium]|nr:methylated-DNA--[protein]-cysteine S-methyltransferase [Clostridiales bacterium]